MTSAIDNNFKFEILSSFPQYNFDYVDLIKELKAVDYEKRGLEFENEHLMKELDAALSMLNKQPAQEPKCSKNPDAPHGFCRDASHSADRYVCECELWEEPTQEPVATLKITSLGEYDLTLNVPTELHYKALIDAVGIGNHSLFIDGSQSSIGGCCNCKASKGIIGSSTFCDHHPAPSWQGLSDDEITELLVSKGETSMKYVEFARAIEQALKERNI